MRYYLRNKLDDQYTTVKEKYLVVSQFENFISCN